MNIVKIVLEVVVILVAMVLMERGLKNTPEKTVGTLCNAFYIVICFAIATSLAQAAQYFGLIAGELTYKPFDVLSLMATAYIIAMLFPQVNLVARAGRKGEN